MTTSDMPTVADLRAIARAAFEEMRREPDADCFRKGDVWQNSIGTRQRIVKVEAGVAHMVNERTGRTGARKWDDIGAHTGRPWVRLSCGA